MTGASNKPNRATDRLSDLDQRISAARDAGKPKPRTGKDKYAAMSKGWQMIVELVLSVMISAAMGWGLDTLFGTLPIMLIVFVGLGFAAGVRMMLRTAAEMQRKQEQAAREDAAQEDRGA